MAFEVFKPGLMVVDMQEDFCEPNGSLGIRGGRELAPVINQLLAMPGFVVKIASRDFHPLGHVSFASSHPGASPFISSHTIRNPGNQAETQTTTLWPDHCVQGTPGCEIIPELHTDKLTHIVDKGMDSRVESYSAFGPPFRDPSIALTGLEKILRDAGVTHLYCVGLAYNVCVKFSAIDAAELGFKAFVVEEGSRGVSDDAVGACRTELEEKGVRVVRMNSGDVQRVMNP